MNDIVILRKHFFEGENGVPLPALVKFVKQAFSYEQWEPFGLLIEPTLQLLQEQSDVSSLVDIKTLQIMLALEPFYNTVKKTKKSTHSDDGDAVGHTQGGDVLCSLYLNKVWLIFSESTEQLFRVISFCFEPGAGYYREVWAEVCLRGLKPWPYPVE